jgi:hypothetical protein
MKATIFKNVKKEQVHQRVASEYSNLIDRKSLGECLYSVISYPGMKNNSTTILSSKDLRKDIKRIENEDNKIIVVAHAFTEEARELLTSLGALYFSKSDFYWTDESIKRIKNS